MIPTVEDLRSDALTHNFGDCFNPPGLTNFLGCVQVTTDLTCLRCLNFPPFATADTPTASFILDDFHFPAHGRPVTITWYPDRIVRESVYQDLHLTSTVALAVGKMAAVMKITIENRSTTHRHVTAGVRVQGGITKSLKPWNQAVPPSEEDNKVAWNTQRQALVFQARHSNAVSMQGTWPPAADVDRNTFRYTVQLEPGAQWHFHYVNVIGEHINEAGSVYDTLIRDVTGELARVRSNWNIEMRALFTPGNGRYSGELPILITEDADIRKLYWMGALGIAYSKRCHPLSVHGRTYDTLMPRYWQTAMVLWDYSLSAPVHALLDPVVMRASLERWMRMDVHKNFGTEYLTGSGIGPWYAVNDYAMVSMAYTYLRWSGDLDWLKHRIGNTSIQEFLLQYALNWKQFKQPSGLAGYGTLYNLLECVSSYTHEIAALNAANVFSLRTIADLLEPSDQASLLRQEATQLIARIQELYVDGKGYWRARHPDGTMHEVRHCYDLLTILNTIPQDLTTRQKTEIVNFFKQELQTETWMHALSPKDEDVLFSVRPDHQWTGAYPAWPPETARGLYRIGQVDLAFSWLKGLARSANQGPFGQAHFAENVIAPNEGGARKSPSEMPYINDWLSSSCGSWVNVILEGIFGLHPTPAKGITASPQFGEFDPKAELLGLRYRGKRFGVNSNGIFRLD